MGNNDYVTMWWRWQETCCYTYSFEHHRLQQVHTRIQSISDSDGTDHTMNCYAIHGDLA